MRQSLWALCYIMAFTLSVAGTGYVGLTKSIALIVAPASNALAAKVAPRPAPLYDPSKPTVAILLGNTATESTDFLGPYAMFAESDAYNVYAVASSRALRTLAGGLDVVPQMSFEELTAQLPQGPDIVVVPAMTNVGSVENAPVLHWLRQQTKRRVLLFSWCEGAEVLAASGLINGKKVTTHWASIARYERAFPAVHWQRGERYVDSGTLLTTAGLTSGIDATLHLLEKRNGAAVAAKVAQALHIPASPFIGNPRMPQYSFEASDISMPLNLAFGWPKRRTGLWLYDGVGELDLTAAIDVYQATDQIHTAAATQSVVSRHGLQFAPRWNAQTLPAMNRMLVPGGYGAAEAAKDLSERQRSGNPSVTLLQNDEAITFPFQTTLEDLARTNDTTTAAFAAKRLEVRGPLNLLGPKLPVRPFLVLLLAGLSGVVSLMGLFRLLTRLRLF